MIFHNTNFPPHPHLITVRSYLHPLPPMFFQNTYNNINTTYHRLSNGSISSNSSENLKNDDGKSLPTINVVTFNGIQKLMELDRHKIEDIIQSKHSYQYDSPFHSSDSNSIPTQHSSDMLYHPH